MSGLPEVNRPRAVRDSKERHGPLLHFDRVARSEFLADARNGELDRP